mmetsp:Transcript_47962/g.124530  ORF Transcript_47962/g.124530 Transcript_47962/m.124530 type:complete len:139 (-) Transcript_47962:545-961(-)
MTYMSPSAPPASHVHLSLSLLVQAPKDGVYVHGLYSEAGVWSASRRSLVQPAPGEMYSGVPVIHFMPSLQTLDEVKAEWEKEGKKMYSAPLYKTSVRAGVLSTTGQSTNFILCVELPSQEESDFWVLQGTALLSQLND